MFPEYW